MFTATCVECKFITNFIYLTVNQLQNLIRIYGFFKYKNCRKTPGTGTEPKETGSETGTLNRNYLELVPFFIKNQNLTGPDTGKFKSLIFIYNFFFNRYLVPTYLV